MWKYRYGKITYRYTGIRNTIIPVFTGYKVIKVRHPQPRGDLLLAPGRDGQGLADLLRGDAAGEALQMRGAANRRGHELRALRVLAAARRNAGVYVYSNAKL